MIGTSMALLLGGLAAAGSSVASAKIGSAAAKKAADAQAAAARSGETARTDALAQTRADLMPWKNAGTDALTKLNEMLSGGRMPTGEYGAFDDSKVKFDPGFEARIKASQDALESWAASKSSFYSGGTGSKLVKNAQENVSGEYNNAWNRDFTKYNANRDTFMLNRNNFLNDKADEWNRLSQVAGAGQNAAAGLGTATMGTADAIAGSREGAGNAQAAGMVGSANAWTGALGNVSNIFQQSALLQSILGQNGGGNMKNAFDTYGSYQGFAPGYARG